MFAYFWRIICGTTVLFVGLTSHSLSLAQSITTTSDETGTIIQQEGNTYRIQGGTRSQDNLFHSFQDFGLNSNEIADFLSSPDIQNILGRVTGGDPSVINGLIQLTGGNSNLYLMNPAGIVFGGNASLNVPGSFVATTSDRIGFAGGWFNATGENNYQDLIGTPDRFAFLSDNPSAVINQANLAVKTGNDVTFIGGTVINTGTISAPGGDITLAAVPGTNLVRISQAGRLLSVELSAEDIAEGITPLELPELLTTPGIEAAIDNLPAPQNGDILISGQIQGETVNFMAANRVNVVDTETPLILTGDGTRSAPTVTIFPENIDDPLAYVFIDALVENYQDFLYNGKAGTVSFVVTPEDNGISFISEQLAQISEQEQKIDEVHILSEGNEGNFWLGNAYVSGETIDQYRDNFQSWRSALSQEADILLYSCFTALGEAGESLMQAIATETGADVAASTNLTGSSVLGGDWILEKQIGNIEANLAFKSSILEEYQNTLAVFTASNSAELIQSMIDAHNMASNDTINLLPNTIFTLSAPLQDIFGTSGTVTINGFNSTIDAQGASRIVTVRPDAILTLNDVTIRNGSVPLGVGVADDGGAILVRQGTLNINNSTLENNTAADKGGAVFVIEGQLNISNSTISGNSAVNGGGIFNDRGTLTISNSTISGNSTMMNGGGVYNGGVTGGISQTSTTTISNSTISGNSSGGKGGGIFNYSSSSYTGILNVYNSTIYGNISPNNGVGIFNEKILGTGNAIANIRNTIIAGNISINQPNERDVKSENSSFNDLGNNLIGVVDGAIGFGTSGTLSGTSTNPLDPVLSPLGNYTGDTQTHIPLPGSPAINTGSTTGTPSTDQRGLSRGTLVDIGSVEVTADLQITQSVSTDTPILNQDIGVVLTVQNLGLDPVGGVLVSSIIPSGITLNSIAASAGSITFSNNTALWTIGNLDGNFDLIAEGNSVTLTLIGRVSDPNIFNLVFLNFIQSNALQGNDPNSSNNNSNSNSILQANDPNSSNNTIQSDLTTIDPNILLSLLDSQSESPLIDRTPLQSIVNTFSDEAIFLEIEDTFSQEYKDYLEIEEEEIITLQEAQNILRNIEVINGITPAVIYAYFKPKNSGLNENELWRFSPRENQQTKVKPEPSPDDELHLLVITPSNPPIHRHLPEVTREKAIAVAENFRRTVTNVRRPNAYLDPAQQMYRWLVGSVVEELEERGVDSLSFVMDRGLRTIPVAALHNGDNFIIDRYSVGMMPSFFLTAPEYRDIKNRQVLAMGADRFVEYAPLPAVPTELELISNKIWQGEFYLNEGFTTDNLKKARSQKSFGIVHLATHGEFKSGKAENSYIQFWDEKLPLTRFRELGLNDAQIELLVLSACRTAFGDSDAELGFAGLAIATGVKTAIGSLWYVNDEGTLALMTGFYSQLDSAAIKVEALRQAQLSLLSGETRFENGQLIFPEGSFDLPSELLAKGDRVFNHPYFWSAFTTIGSPW
ncbi:CHAT domain-containing protein [Spirulina sp. 06S082]|uniref:CHAT domain-containing protein n=1 Tax=Spirulina sp. 06S082 TaxID=3110248 RepID=UPI002B213E7C|nr:CHAT domain-containing protein [Spirulina sp. 06S082]MEA5468828.1 CHAT domain-containing protein [Spirulina sp. 06S082]